MAIFSIRTISKPPSWIISNGHISATAHDLLYSAHRAVIFAIAQLSCLNVVHNDNDNKQRETITHCIILCVCLMLIGLKIVATNSILSEAS